jgi:hypothetical protein
MPPPFRIVVRSPADAQTKDKWTQIGTGAGWRVGSPFFNRPCCMPSGKIVTIWNAPSSPATASGIAVFDPGTGLWSYIPEASIRWPASWPMSKNGLQHASQWENCFSDWDEVTGSVFWSAGGPIDTNHNDTRFDPATNTLTWFAPGLVGSDRMGGVWNGKAYMFGMMSGEFNQIQFRVLPNGVRQFYRDTVIPPYDGTLELSGANMGIVRGGIDHRTGHAWMFTNAGELYMRDLSGGPSDGLGWNHLATSGRKPAFGFSACLVEHLDKIACFTGNGTGNSETGPTADARKTYILDLATLHWRAGPQLPSTVPPGFAQTQNNMLYDRFNKKTYCLTLGSASTAGYTVWRLDIEETQL